MENHYVKASSAQFAGKVGENYVSYMFSKNDIVCNSLAESDFGEDFLCDIFVASNNPKIKVRTNFSFRTQVKSTECPSQNGYVRKTSYGYAVKLSVGLLTTWKDSFYPVVLVIYDCSESCAYWCFPIEQVSGDFGDTDTKTITAPLENRFDDNGIRRIREKIVEYYSNLFKIQDTSLKCSIFPIWMPQYRLLTGLEIFELFPENEEIKPSYRSRNLLPSYISSYHTCQYGDALACLEYSSTYQSLESYVDNLIAYLGTINYRPTEEKWLSLIISPIDIVAKHENRCISTATEWISLSLLSNGLVYDHSHNFDPGPNYHYSERIRALSDDSDFFIHESGEFVTETIVESYLFNSRKQHFYLTNDILDKSMCILDISECTELQVADLENWCHENDHQLILIEDDIHAIVAHPFLSFYSYGATFPGTARWSDWDKLKYNTSEFASTIPCGIPLSRIEKLAFLDNIPSFTSDDGDACSLDYSNALAGETLIHNKRTIRLICYILPMDTERCDNFLSDAEKRIQSVYPNCRLYCDVYDDLWDIILEVTPTTVDSTQSVLSTVEKAFLDLVAKIKQESNTSKNMAYYTKMILDRWIPSCVPVSY